jgi:hypothetical protein
MDIALALSDIDNDDDQHIPLIVSRMRYAGIVQRIKTYLTTMGRHSDQDANRDNDLDDGSLPPHLIPTEDEFHAALKVLQYLQLLPVTNLGIFTCLKDVVAAIRTQ